MGNWKIKICGNRFMEDSYAAALNRPDYMGWIFSPHSPRRIPMDRARLLIGEIRRSVPEIRHVGVFAGNTVGEILRIQREVPGLDYFQITDGPGFIESLRSRLGKKLGARVIPAIRVKKPLKDLDLICYGPAPFFILDAYQAGRPGGTGKRLDASLIRGITRPYLLAGGLNPENVLEALRETGNARGADAASGLEISPGRKDLEKLTQFVRSLRA